MTEKEWKAYDERVSKIVGEKGDGCANCGLLALCRCGPRSWAGSKIQGAKALAHEAAEKMVANIQVSKDFVGDADDVASAINDRLRGAERPSMMSHHGKSWNHDQLRKLIDDNIHGRALCDRFLRWFGGVHLGSSPATQREQIEWVREMVAWLRPGAK